MVDAPTFGPFTAWDQWLQFLGWTAADAVWLRRIDWPRVAARVVPRFYERIQKTPALDALVRRTTTYESLHRTLAQYIRSLENPPEGKAYLQEIHRIAAAHVRVGLGPDWYMAAYRLLWVEAERQVRAQFAARPEDMEAGLEAVTRRLMADMVLTVALYDEERRRLAYRDPLTRALSRAGHQEWLEQRRRQGAAQGLVIAADLDDFKWINDTWGHFAGDALLSAVADRLAGAVRPGDAVVRTGGDEFVVWMPGVAPSDAGRVVSRLHAVLVETPYVVDAEPIQLGVSMGYATGPLEDETARAADDALLAAKRAGKNRIVAASAEPRRSGIDQRLTTPGLGWLVTAVEAFWRRWPQPALLTDRTGTILAANPAFAEMTGYPLSELVGRHTRIFSAGRTPPAVYAALWERLESGQSWHGVFENRRRDGSTWWAEETIAPVVLGSRIVGFWAAVQEVAPSAQAPLQASVLDGTTLAPVFQPLRDLATERVVGYEALIRPKRGGQPIPPLELFGIAERLGDVVRVDRACVLSLFETIQAHGGWPTSAGALWVNVRPETVAAEGVWAELRALLALVAGDQVIWELGEHGQARLTPGQWNAPRDQDLTIALDDVGVADHEGLRLVASPVRWIKLDRSLTSELPRSGRARRWVRHLVRWAHAEGIRVVAEGIETAQERDAARALGVDLGQGFWWEPPGPGPWLDRHSA
ncbi:MAG: EAL domain-containing protein [Firmicutes bacterium]|nr:EAL domain-containing protein [Alicyclobacillaceae bacterium]MCL6497049.1 EAL domain-containing protein [Bacillota bacterium]